MKHIIPFFLLKIWLFPKNNKQNIPKQVEVKFTIPFLNIYHTNLLNHLGLQTKNKINGSEISDPDALICKYRK
jgi:hypothetical protein